MAATQKPKLLKVLPRNSFHSFHYLSPGCYYACTFNMHMHVVLNVVLVHSRPQSPSFVGHVVGYKISRVVLGTRMVLVWTSTKNEWNARNTI